MNQARRIRVIAIGLEAAVPTTVHVAQTDAVNVGAAVRHGRLPGRAPGCEEFENGVVSRLDRRGGRPSRCVEWWLQRRSRLQEQGERNMNPHNRCGCDMLTLACCNTRGHWTEDSPEFNRTHSSLGRIACWRRLPDRGQLRQVVFQFHHRRPAAFAAAARDSTYAWIARSCDELSLSPNDGIPSVFREPPITIDSNCRCTSAVA